MGEQQVSAILGASSSVKHRSAQQWAMHLSLLLIKIAEKKYLIGLFGCDVYNLFNKSLRISF